MLQGSWSCKECRKLCTLKDSRKGPNMQCTLNIPVQDTLLTCALHYRHRASEKDCACAYRSFQKSFSGVDVLPGFADGSALVQIENAANLAIVDSLISNIPGNVMIQNSSIQVLRSNFILNSGDAAGALTIESSQVGLLFYHKHCSISVHLLQPNLFPLP